MDIFFLVTGILIVGFFIFRISKRGISKRYERKTQTPWSALNDGVDPTL